MADKNYSSGYGDAGKSQYNMNAMGMSAYAGIMGLIYRKIEEVIQQYVENAMIYGEMANALGSYNMNPAYTLGGSSGDTDSGYNGGSIDSKLSSTPPSNLEILAGSGGTTAYAPKE